MLWTVERGWDRSLLISARRIHLRLGDEESTGQIGVFQPGGAEVSADEVCLPEVGFAKVCDDQVGAAQICIAQVRAAKFGSNQVGSPTILPLALPATHQRAGMEQ
jgi:hypothetical protein